MVDFISHILVGGILSVLKKFKKLEIYWIIFFSVLADIPQIFLYLYLGVTNSRLFFIPLNSDWTGFREVTPLVDLLWEFPHSLLFVFIIILPIILYFKLPKMAFVAYLGHIFIDIFTHTGEWAVEPLYPLQYKFLGFTNVWSWPLHLVLLLWILLILIIHFIYQFKKRR
jgi:hypothetical protein